MNKNDVINNFFLKIIKENNLKIYEYKSKDIIFRESSPCKNICYILSGEVEISTLSYNGNQEVISQIKENNFFGQYILFQENGKYLGDVVAKGTLKLIMISKNELLNYLSNDLEFLEAYISFISNESFNIKQQVKLLSHKNALDRVIFYLENNSINNICYIESVSELARYINLPRETVSRMLSRLENDRFIIKDKNKITLLK